MPHALDHTPTPAARLPHRHPPWPCTCSTTLSDLKANRLLGALPEPLLQRWLPHIEAVDMPLGMVLGESGRPQQHVYFPTTSVAALMYGLEDGRTAAVSVVGSEGLVGVSTLMGDGGSPGRAVVLSAGRGYRMSASAMMCDREPGNAVTLVLLRYTQALMTQLAQVVVCNRLHTIETRLCRFLLSMVERLHGGTELMMTHEMLAGVLGVRREGVTEAALRLQRLGLLRYRRGHLTVLDRAGLAGRSCECHVVVKKEYERLLPTPSPDVATGSVAALAAERSSRAGVWQRQEEPHHFSRGVRAGGVGV